MSDEKYFGISSSVVNDHWPIRGCGADRSNSSTLALPADLNSWPNWSTGTNASLNPSSPGFERS